MNFKECYEIAVKRVDEDTTDIDPLALDVIKNGVNEGYMFIAKLVDKTTTDYIVSFEKIIPLPSDYADLVSINHENLGLLSKLDFAVRDDKVYMNTIGITEGDLTLSYVKYPPRLKNDGDVLAIKDAYCVAPAIYGAYEYMLHKKKYSAAQLLLMEFNTYLPKNQQVQGENKQ